MYKGNVVDITHLGISTVSDTISDGSLTSKLEKGGQNSIPIRCSITTQGNYYWIDVRLAGGLK